MFLLRRTSITVYQNNPEAVLEDLEKPGVDDEPQPVMLRYVGLIFVPLSAVVFLRIRVKQCTLACISSLYPWFVYV